MGRHSVLQQFSGRKTAVQALLTELMAHPAIQESDILLTLQAHLEHVQAERLRVVVAGQFSAGKSTFLNALMGRDFFHSALQPTTAVAQCLRSVKPGDPRAQTVQVHFRDGRPPASLNLEHEADRAAWRSYATSLEQDASRSSEVLRIDLFYPVPQMGEDLLLVDSPGLNAARAGHQEVAFREIEAAHAVIYLFHPRGVTDADMRYLREITRLRGRAFFVLNRIDMIRAYQGESAEQIARQIEEALRAANLGLPPESIRVYPLSALLGLQGKDADRPAAERAELLARSGLPAFEELLWRFAASDERLQLIFDEAARAVAGASAALLRRLQGEAEAAAAADAPDPDSPEGALQRLLEQHEQAIVRLQQFIGEQVTAAARDAEGHMQTGLTAALGRLNDEVGAVQDHAQYASLLQTGQFRRRAESALRTAFQAASGALTGQLTRVERMVETGKAELFRTIFPAFENVPLPPALKELALNEAAFAFLRDGSHEQTLRELRAREADLEQQRRSVANAPANLTAARAEEQRTAAAYVQLDQQYQGRLAQLGDREPEPKRTTREQPVAREGFWGWVKDRFTTEYETYYEYDYTARDGWRAQHQQLQAASGPKLDRARQDRDLAATRAGEARIAQKRLDQIDTALLLVRSQVEQERDRFRRWLEQLTRQALAEEQERLLRALSEAGIELERKFAIKAGELARQFRATLLEAIRSQFAALAQRDRAAWTPPVADAAAALDAHRTQQLAAAIAVLARLKQQADSLITGGDKLAHAWHGTV